MSHEIMGSRFLARSKPAWHNLGSVFAEDEKLTASQAVARVAGDITFEKHPVYYGAPDAVGRPAFHEIPDQRAIVRLATADSPAKVLGLATDSWAADSYHDLARTLDPLHPSYPVETAGVLKDGGLLFLCFRGEDWAVKGDAMRSYFAANLSMTPGEGHRIFHSPVRVVCWNTNTMAQGQATINLSVPHSADAKQRFTLAAKLVTQFAEMKDKAQAIFTAFGDRQVTAKDVDDIIYAAFQLPKLPSKLALLKHTLSETEAQAFRKGLTADLLLDLNREQERYDRQCETVAKLRDAARESFEKFNPANLRGTAWAAYNAVTEVADWREGRSADESALFGSRAQEKSRAFEAAMALVAK